MSHFTNTGMVMWCEMTFNYEDISIILQIRNEVGVPQSSGAFVKAKVCMRNYMQIHIYIFNVCPRLPLSLSPQDQCHRCLRCVCQGKSVQAQDFSGACSTTTSPTNEHSNPQMSDGMKLALFKKKEKTTEKAGLVAN